MQIMEDVDGITRAANSKGFYPIQNNHQAYARPLVPNQTTAAPSLASLNHSTLPGSQLAFRPTPVASQMTNGQSQIRNSPSTTIPGRPASFQSLMRQVGYYLSRHLKLKFET